MSGSSTAAPAETIERLWQAARFLPQTVRLLGTRYRTLFLAYALGARAAGEAAAVADALAFAEFMLGQDRIALLPPELRAVRADARALRRRYRLVRAGGEVRAALRWRILRWLRL